MNSSAYAEFYACFEAQEWVLPYYLTFSRVLALVGTICFVFLSFIILKKTRTLNKEFATALFYSLLSPTLMSCYVGVFYLPNIIIPYDVIMVHGLVRSPQANHVGCIAFSFFCVPYISSLIYLGIIYSKAFFKPTHFHVDKWIQVAIGIGSMAIVIVGCLLTYQSFGYKQKWKRNVVIAGNLLNKKIFDEYGGFVVNMVEAPSTMTITVVILGVQIVGAWIVGALLIVKIYQTMLSRKQALSKNTYGLQRMFIYVFVLHVGLFTSMYGFPATVVFFAIYFKITDLSRCPVGVLCTLSLCAMPTVYCLSYLYFVSPIRHAFVRLVQRKKATRRISTVTSKRISLSTEFQSSF